MICSTKFSRWVPINYILLIIVTAGQSYTLGLLCSEYTPESVFSIFVLTCASFAGMTFYAVWTKHDISILYSIASGTTVCMITFAILLIFEITNSALTMVYSCLGVILALVFVAIDTRIIIKDRKYGIGVDDFIRAALLLYIDIISIFVHLLRICCSRKINRWDIFLVCRINIFLRSEFYE